MSKTLLRWLYPPLMLVGFNRAAIAIIAGDAPHLLLLPLLALAIAVSFAVERAIPYQEEWNTSHADTQRDVAHALVNETSALLAVLALPALASVFTVADVWP